jgi:hypothetical protein
MEAASSVEAKIRTFIECKIGYFEQNRDFKIRACRLSPP